MKVIYLVVLLIGIQLNVSAGDGLSFNWMEGKTQVGTLHITTSENEKSTSYTFSSTMKVDYGEEITFQDAFGSTYRNDSLVEASAKRSFNGREKVSIVEHIIAESRTRLVSGKEKALERNAVVYDYVLLFVKPPSNVKFVYSTLYGTDFKVSANGNNSYTVTSTKNRTEIFTYDEKGKLIKVVVNLNVGTYTLVPNTDE